jgi:hypothetical protein
LRRLSSCCAFHLASSCAACSATRTLSSTLQQEGSHLVSRYCVAEFAGDCMEDRLCTFCCLGGGWHRGRPPGRGPAATAPQGSPGLSGR